MQEFERPKIPDAINVFGLKGSIKEKVYKLILKQGGVEMFTIKQNDDLPILELQLFDYDNNPINLELCSVKFHMSDRHGEVKINRPVKIVNTETGEVRVNWLNGDTDSIGMYQSEFEINMPDGKIVTVPSDGYLTINIIKELA